MATQIYLGNPPENIKKWIKENYKSKKNVPLHFTANEPESSVSLMALDYNTDEQCESWCSFVYSTDEMKTWNDYTIGQIIYLDNCENKTVYIQAKYGDTEDNPNKNGLADYTYWEEEDNYAIIKYHQFVMEGSIKAGGNIQFLLDNTGSRMDVTTCCYSYMFSYCTSLTQAPELPATTLADRCYYAMFLGCSSLTQAPELPATSLAVDCYNRMFAYCSSLTQAPELPATTLSYCCYSNMFVDCTSLTQAPELPATTLAESCYAYMFWGCKLPFTFPDKTFDEMVDLIQDQWLIGEYWYYYDEEDNEVIINPVEIICSDKTMLATFDIDEYTWTLTEK